MARKKPVVEPASCPSVECAVQVAVWREGFRIVEAAEQKREARAVEPEGARRKRAKRVSR